MKIFSLLLSTVTLLVSSALAQQSNPLPPVSSLHDSKLTKFNLDFPGGTPQELVAAIQKATGKPLNAIMLPEDAKQQLPPLKMSGVDVPQLFGALSEATMRLEYRNGMQVAKRISFETRPGMAAQDLSDDSIWFFREYKNGSEEKACRFYLLTPYLDAGLTVDDITTAVQTAWKLQAYRAMPELNFHKETKLLIGVGERWQLDAIDGVLQALAPTKAKSAGAAISSEPVGPAKANP